MTVSHPGQVLTLGPKDQRSGSHDWTVSGYLSVPGASSHFIDIRYMVRPYAVDHAT